MSTIPADQIDIEARRVKATFALAMMSDRHHDLRKLEAQARLDLAAAILELDDADHEAEAANQQINDLQDQWSRHVNDHGCLRDQVAVCSELQEISAQLGKLTRRHTLNEQAEVEAAKKRYAQALADLIRGEAS